MKIFDKAQWHIDSDEDAAEVIAKFREVFSFLNAKKMLSEEGMEIFEFWMDDSVSLNEKMVTQEGSEFLEENYDDVINCNSQTIFAELESKYLNK